MCWRKSTLAMIILLLSGCSAIGPGTVKRDRFDYNTAVSDSWKEQTLLNIIKIRYAAVHGSGFDSQRIFPGKFG